MSFALAVVGLTCGSLVAIVHHLRRAPEAFEDETGFHLSSPTGNRLPEEAGLPLGAEADGCAALFQAQSNVSLRHDTPDSIGITVPRVREAH